MLEEWIRRNREIGHPHKWSINPNKKKYLLVILICIGLLVLIWPVSQTQPNAPNTAGHKAPDVKADNIKNSLAHELEGILSKIDGAGTVNVSLTLSSDGIKSYASNIREEKRDIQETDNRGLKKTTSEHNTTRDLAASSGNPLLIEERNPEILGVLIVADGANDSRTAEQLTNATATLLDIPAHKVTVMPRMGGK